MLPTLNIGLAILSFTITNRKAENFQVIAGGAKEEVEIPKRIDLTEIRSICRDDLVV